MIAVFTIPGCTAFMVTLAFLPCNPATELRSVIEIFSISHLNCLYFLELLACWLLEEFDGN